MQLRENTQLLFQKTGDKKNKVYKVYFMLKT